MPNFRASVGHGPFIHVKRANPVTLAGQAVGLTVGSPASWQLAPGHFIPAKMPMEIISPRPDNETQPYERCRKCPSEVPFRYKMGIQGGAYPFHFQIMAGPVDLTIGQDWFNTDYGIINWTSPSIGSHPITVRVTDQDGTIVERSWTLTVANRESTADFIWLSMGGGSMPMGSNAASGAFSSPKRDLDGFYLGLKSDSTHANKQIWYFGGTYLVTDTLVQPTSNVDFGTGKPKTHYGYPGDVATIDCQNTAYLDWETNTNGGICYGNLRFVNPQVPESGLLRKQFIRGPSIVMRRFVGFELFFDGGGNTESNGGSNSSAIMFSSGPGSYHHVSHSTFHRCDNMDTILCYGTSYGVIEDNVITGGYGGTFNPSWGFFLKGGPISFMTTRHNVGIQSGNTRPLSFVSEFTNQTKGNLEFCWNSYKCTQSTEGAAGGFPMGQGGGGDGPYAYGPIYHYRNNLDIHHTDMVTIRAGTTQPIPGPVTFENDVIQHNAAFNADQGIHVVNSPQPPLVLNKTNLLTGNSGMLDPTTNLLIGASRNSSLGTHGSEIA